MPPAELLDDHRRQPRNLGKLLNASAVGDVGSIVAGDALRFYIQVEGGRIAAARFQVFNASEQVAAASAVTELCVGRTVTEAMLLGPLDLCRHLGGLDPADLPVLVWGLEGLRAACAAHAGEDLDADDELDPLLCRCHGIPAETVRQSIQVMGLDTVDAVVDATGAGTGCGSCRADIPRLLDETAGAPPPPPGRRSGAQGRIPQLLRIRQVVAERIAPQLSAQGGGIELWDFDGRTVTVGCTGFLATDPEARRQALTRLEAALKADIDPALGVAERTA